MHQVTTDGQTFWDVLDQEKRHYPEKGEMTSVVEDVKLELEGHE